MPSRPATAARAPQVTEGTPASHRESHAVVERLGAALSTAGFPPMPSRVFAALLVDDDGRMTSAELTDELSVSPAAVSGAVRYLTHVGLLRRERERGGRRDVFVVLDDAFHGALTNTDQVYAGMIQALADGVDHLGAGSTAGQRLQLSREFLEFVTEEMSGIIDRWEAYKATR
ncbi:GbsR/MarR family transcriptional regulator [Knoellia locipacati]|uniref:GbsR/MarR family transcriptional regulator n=1 Tax=Knoellia locipacati TaxID=882824 RepID=UPI0011BF0391|nr:MarR family transcriptional regulator [Knoellia locipacati]